jgi:superfamily II DNA or RNA helicase
VIELRDYQHELIADTRASLAVHNSTVMQLATGGGKTLTTGYIVKSAIEKGRRAIFCVHRIELVNQTSAAFNKLDIPHGFITAQDDYDSSKLVHIASIDTLRRRLDDVIQPDLLIIDEAHRAMAETWQKVINHWPNAKKLLITATPERLDGKGLKHVAQDLVLGKSTRWLIDHGYLTMPRSFAPSEPDLTGVKTTAGDYKIDDLAMVMDNSSITGNAVTHYKKHCDNMQAIVFAVTIEHSKNVVKEFLDNGIPAAHCDGSFSKIQREDIIERYRYGETKVLSNVNLFTEGFDVPNVQAAILLRPTKSLAMYLQMGGRALRPVYADGYDIQNQQGRLDAIANGHKPFAIILDHAGNTKRHGLLHIERSWSLEGKKGRPKSKIVNSTCEVCFCTWERKPNKPIACPACGWMPEKKEKEGAEYVEGDLQEITEQNNPWAWAKTSSLTKVMSHVKTRKDLQDIAKARGYKHGWVFYKAKELGL